jgi:phosphoribosylpyrophosphate synthetase
MRFKHIVTSPLLRDKFSYPVGADTKTLTRTSKIYSDMLMEVYDGRDIYLLCTGSSGSMIAGGICVFHPNIRKIIYIYKNDEPHHCTDMQGLEVLTNDTKKAIVFVDDFVETGASILRVVDYVAKANEINPYISLDAVLVSGVVYNSLSLKRSDVVIDTLICAEYINRS